MELYELMQEPSGATSVAIRDKHHLMSLQYIRAEAPTLDDGNAQEEAVAVTAREFIEEATRDIVKEISQREHTDADGGAAARYLLALEQGTASMPLHERRKRAADCLHMDDVASLRHQYKSKKRGVAETNETKLMDAVADKLMEREVDYLRGLSADKEPSEIERDEPWLKAVHNTWEAARLLSMTLKLCCGYYRGPGEEYHSRYDYTSLELFGKFWKYVKIPAEDDPFVVTIGKPDEKLSSLFVRGLTARLFVSSPFEREIIEKLSTDVVVAPDGDPIPIIRDLITDWRAWIDTCPCTMDPPVESCEVHRFRSTLEEYIKELRKCWDELRDPYHTPAHYRTDHSPAKIMERYGLRVPPIDKATKYSV